MYIFIDKKQNIIQIGKEPYSLIQCSCESVLSHPTSEHNLVTEKNNSDRVIIRIPLFYFLKVILNNFKEFKIIFMIFSFFVFINLFTYYIK